jgi:hypothetical protein
MKAIRALAIAFLYLFAFLNFTGCAHFTVPAPAALVRPLAETAIENSTITLPITLSIKSFVRDIRRMLPQNKSSDDHDQREKIAGALQEFLNRQASRINTDYLSNVYLREKTQHAWDALQSPIKLSNDLSLVLNPQAVYVSPPPAVAGQVDDIHIVVELVARPKLVAGSLPHIPARSLPNFSGAPSGRGFHLALETELSFDFISRELAKRMVGREYMIDAKKIIIENVRLYGSGYLVVMMVRINGAVRGSVYLTGMPAYDESTRTLFVKNVEYSVETKQTLAHVADWLLHARLRESLADQAKWFIGDKIDVEKELLSKGLNRNLGQQVSISGTIDSIRPVAVGMTERSLKAVLVMDGAVGVKVL